MSVCPYVCLSVCYFYCSLLHAFRRINVFNYSILLSRTYVSHIVRTSQMLLYASLIIRAVGLVSYPVLPCRSDLQEREREIFSLMTYRLDKFREYSPIRTQNVFHSPAALTSSAPPPHAAGP